MKLIFGEDKGYSTVDNNELVNLNHSLSSIEEIVSTLGNYKVSQTAIVNDPESTYKKNLKVLARNESGKKAIFSFEKYGIKYVKLNNRRISKNVLQTKKDYLNLSAMFTAKMIENNDQNYKNSALAYHTNVIEYLKNKIHALSKLEPTSEDISLEIQEDIKAKESIIKNHEYTLRKINEILSTKQSVGER